MKNKKCCGECWQHPCPLEKKKCEPLAKFPDDNHKFSFERVSAENMNWRYDFPETEIDSFKKDRVIDIDVDAIYHTHEQMVKRLIDELEAPQYRKLTFREKYYGILPWLAIGIVVWIFIFTLARVVAADEGLQEIKRGVDARGEYVFYTDKIRNLSAAPDGPFKGNCTVFAKTYIKKAREAGYYANLYIMDKKLPHHVVALATGKDGQYYVLDNRENQIVPQWKHKQRWGY